MSKAEKIEYEARQYITKLGFDIQEEKFPDYGVGIKGNKVFFNVWINEAKTVGVTCFERRKLNPIEFFEKIYSIVSQ